MQKSDIDCHLSGVCLHLQDTLQFPGVLLHCSSQEFGVFFGSGLLEENFLEETGNYKAGHFSPQVVSSAQ